jgi:hypothetical protein
MTQINESTRTELQSATTERKSRRGRRMRTAAANSGATPVNQVAETAQATHGVSKMNTHATGTDILNGATLGKFVLFGIPRGDQVKDGPVMRGLVEVKTEGQGAPVKVQVAAWLKIGRSNCYWAKLGTRSIGRAPGLQQGGWRFDPARLH